MSIPATPGQAAPTQEPSQPATPGTSQANDQQPPSAPAQPPSEERVSISPKEYAQLQRDRARLQSLQKRTSRGAQPTKAAQPGEPGYDENDVIAEERNKRLELEQQIFQRDVKDNVRDLLSKPEFANLPESTRKLILRNPHSLSEAEDLDGVVSDIEDFLREEVAAMTPPPQTQQPAPQPGQQPQGQQPPPQQQQQGPQGHETPPKVGAGSPQSPPAQQLEDTKGLTGTNRSRAVLRNAMKRARGIQE